MRPLLFFLGGQGEVVLGEDLSAKKGNQGLYETRRMCEGVTGLATAELECDVREFFSARKIDLGGKTLGQYPEQLRITVALREREGTALSRHLAKFEN